jgi:hypothetical protein
VKGRSSRQDSLFLGLQRRQGPTEASGKRSSGRITSKPRIPEFR